MPGLVDRLTELSERRRRIVQSIQAGTGSAVREILDKLLDLLGEYLEDHDRLSLGELASLNQLEDLVELIELAGGDKLEDSIRKQIEELAEVLADQLAEAGLGEAHVTLDEAALEAYTSYQVRTVVEDFEASAAKQIQKAWVESTFTGKPLREALADATIEAQKTLTELTPAQVETHVGTAVSSIDRAITGKVGAKDDSIVYVYVGPQDDITRESCKHIIGKWLTKDQIARLRNKQIPNVATSGGGWNCRHSFQPVKRSIAEKRKIPQATDADIAAFNAAAKGKK